MAVHPDLVAYVEAVRQAPSVHPSSVDPVERRNGYRSLGVALWPELAAMASVTDVTLNTPTPLRARLYVPTTVRTDALLVHFHGGSFVVGDLDSHQGICRRLASDVGARLISIDYRLAPEYPFPAPVDDAIEAVRYIGAHRGEFALPDSPLVVIGDSAGGNLAAVVAAQTRGENLVHAQVLLYPPVGPEMLTPSAHEFGSGFLLELDHLHYDYGQYLGSFTNHADPRVTLVLNSDLEGSPPAIVVVAECDPLRDEALAYAGLLEHFGTEVEVLEAAGMVHGFLQLGGAVPECLDVLDDVAHHLERVLAS